MNSSLLPKQINRIIVPPIKCQGIKTKLVSFIATNILWDGNGRWVEPFLGSGVVAFNIRPKHALLNDSNPHIINLYQGIFEGKLTPKVVAEYLLREGAILAKEGEEHYYRIRERFNETGSSLDFLFLNRACFNGVMRFNGKGKFNVPFCRKPDRFRGAYITKIVNQVQAVWEMMQGQDWVFTNQDWQDCFRQIEPEDFVYLDPPYVGRHTDYYNQWSASAADELAQKAQALPCGIALSMWKENKYRQNDHIEQSWGTLAERTISHFYHVGSTEDLRNAMTEAVLITPKYAVFDEDSKDISQVFFEQLRFDVGK